MTRSRILLCGAGRWGRNYARVLSEHGLLGLVSDPDEGMLDGCRKLIGTSALLTTMTLAELLHRSETGDIDAVIIATPAETHYELALCAIEAGRHVLVEKPMAMDFRAAEHLVAAAAERDVKLQVGHLFELNPGVCTLHSWIKEGRLGRLQYLFSHQLSPGRIRQKEDVLLSLAPHDVSILLKLAGARAVLQVTAFGCEHAEPEVAGMAVVHMSFRDGDPLKAHAHVSWLHPEKVRRVVAVGSEGAAVLDDQARSLVLYERLRGENPFPSSHIEQYDYAGVEPLRVQVRAFERYITDSVAPATTGKGALKVMAVLDAARRSLLSGSLPTQVSYG